MNLRTIAWTALAVAGCDKEINPKYCAVNTSDPRCGTSDAPPIGDGGPGGDGDAPAATICVGTGAYQVCLADPPTPRTVPAGMLDTDSTAECLMYQPSGWMAAHQPEACFIVGSTIAVSSGVVAQGTRALVLVATDSITITATIDAAGKASNPAGLPAGFDPAVCSSFGQAAASNTSGGGGGAGGTFMTSGADGGAGNNGTAQGGLASTVASAPAVLRGGCKGQNGGDGDTAGNSGKGGTGGGAVYLLAMNSIELGASAVINVSGAGGHQGQKHSGGGGAGAGGMILVYASSIAITAGATVIANGGGGSGGGTTASGMIGSDPAPAMPLVPALGGPGPGGIGGSGYAGGVDATNGMTAATGGGGGGGGAGYIQANHALTNATVSPAETVVP